MGAEWYDNPAVSAQDAVRILVHQIQQSGPISEPRRRCRWLLLLLLAADCCTLSTGCTAVVPPQPCRPSRLPAPPPCPGPCPAAEQRHLQLLYRRCQTPDDLDKALKLTRLNYLARGELQQHKPFSHKTSEVLIHVS